MLHGQDVLISHCNMKAAVTAYQLNMFRDETRGHLKENTIQGQYTEYKMKQLDIEVSPPAFVWNPYLTFDLVPRDLYLLFLEHLTIFVQ